MLRHSSVSQPFWFVAPLLSNEAIWQHPKQILQTERVFCNNWWHPRNLLTTPRLETTCIKVLFGKILFVELKNNFPISPKELFVFTNINFIIFKFLTRPVFNLISIMFRLHMILESQWNYIFGFNLLDLNDKKLRLYNFIFKQKIQELNPTKSFCFVFVINLHYFRSNYLQVVEYSSLASRIGNWVKP